MTQPESSEYAPFDTITVGPPERPEPDHAALLKADRVPYSALLKELRWTESDFHTAKRYGFPAATSFILSGVVNVRREPVFSRAQIAKWLEASKAFAAKVK